jgi:hypothetical protein
VQQQFAHHYFSQEFSIEAVHTNDGDLQQLKSSFAYFLSPKFTSSKLFLRTSCELLMQTTSLVLKGYASIKCFSVFLGGA